MTTKPPVITPWGRANHTYQLGKSPLWFTETSSHGGAWLPPAETEILRDIAMPFGWQPFTKDWSWLEEDCDLCVAILLWPEAFPYGRNGAEQRAYDFVKSFLPYFPVHFASALRADKTLRLERAAFAVKSGFKARS